MIILFITLNVIFRIHTLIVKESFGDNKKCDCEGRTFICEMDGKLAGKLCLHHTSWYFSELRHLYVYEEFRRKGVARFISNELFKIITTPIILATVREDNFQARNMLRGFGYVESEHFKSKISGKEIIMVIKNIGGSIE